MTAKEKEDAINELTAYIHCLKCDRSGKVCDDNCPTQYEAGNCGEIIKNLEFLLEEVKKMPTLFKSAYNLLANYEPLEPCEDAISKKAVLDLIEETGKFFLCARIEELPPIQPKAKSGKWINNGTQDSMIGEEYKCSICNEEFILDHNFNYCPNCGAKMQEVEE